MGTLSTFASEIMRVKDQPQLELFDKIAVAIMVFTFSTFQYANAQSTPREQSGTKHLRQVSQTNLKLAQGREGAGAASPAIGPSDETPVPGGEPGSAGGGMPGSSDGFPGLPDTDARFQKELRDAAKKGKRSEAYIGSLLELGMHYNRQNRFASAERVLTEALAIVDGGAIKNVKKPLNVSAIKETVHPDGTVSAQNLNPPSAYEQLMENLLPALIAAEIQTGHLSAAEIYAKRTIAFLSGNPGGKPGLMSAYWQYAEILRKQKRYKEAAAYKKKGDTINASFIGL